MLRLLFGFLLGLSFGLGGAWYVHDLTLKEYVPLAEASDDESYINNHLVYWGLNDTQLRCSVARNIIDRYHRRREAHPLQESVLFGELVPMTNNLVELSMKEYEESGIETSIVNCPKFEYDCSKIESNVDRFFCSGDLS